MRCGLRPLVFDNWVWWGSGLTELLRFAAGGA